MALNHYRNDPQAPGRYGATITYDFDLNPDTPVPVMGFGWGKNGGVTMGDVNDALGGRAFGAAPTVLYAISPATVTIDCSLGSDFYMKMAASSVVKIGNPTNYQGAEEITIHIAGITTFGTIVWGTLYATTGSLATFSTGKVKSIGFKYLPQTGKFTETYRTTSKTG